MKIFVASNSFYLKKDKIDFILQNFALNKIINLDVVEDFEVIINLYKYNILQQPILYVVDLVNIAKLKASELEQLQKHDATNYICFYTGEEINSKVNKIKNSCEFEYIVKIKALKDKMEYLATFTTKLGLNANYDVLKHLLTLCNNDLDLAINESNKLYVYYNNQEISNSHVNIFIRDQRQDSMFDFYALLYKNDKTKLLYYINSFIESSNMVLVFNGLKNYVFLTYQVKILLNENYDYVAISKKLKRHEFYIQNICKNLHKVRLTDIESLNDKLIKIDLNLKNSRFELKKIMYDLLV